MEKNKIIRIVAIIAIIVLSIALIYFLFIHRENKEGNNLTVAEKIILNSNETEVLEVLKSIDLKNQNENTEGEADNTENEKTLVKDYIVNIYEARKNTTESGITYLFDADIKTKDSTTRRKIVVIDGEINSMTLTEEDYAKVEKTDDSFSNDLTIGFMKAYSQAVEELWEKAEVIENIDYFKIKNML